MIEFSLNFKKSIKITLLNLLSFEGKSKSFLFLYFIFSIFIFDISKAETSNLAISKNNQIEVEYLDSKNELEDYILDTGDVLSIDFKFGMFNGYYRVNEEGELFLPEIDETYVRGLTTSELKTLLNEKYTEYLIDPEIKVRIAIFKSMRVLVSGELRKPGFYKFPEYKSGSNLSSRNSMFFDKFKGNNNNQLNLDEVRLNKSFDINQDQVNLDQGLNINQDNEYSENIVFERLSENIITVSDIIRRSGGITSSTDLSRIEIIRDIPMGKGGGKKKAFIDFSSYINESETSNDIRIFDGDTLFFPKLSKPNRQQIPKSVLTGLSPKYISVTLFGRLETTGTVRLPLEASLSDAMDVSGPRKPLSGKIVLIRYENDGTLLKNNISYSATAKRGSKRNPYLKENDLITVRNSFIGKSTAVIKEFTAPFFGINQTKELIENF